MNDPISLTEARARFDTTHRDARRDPTLEDALAWGDRLVTYECTVPAHLLADDTAAVEARVENRLLRDVHEQGLSFVTKPTISARPAPLSMPDRDGRPTVLQVRATVLTRPILRASESRALT